MKSLEYRITLKKQKQNNINKGWDTKSVHKMAIETNLPGNDLLITVRLLNLEKLM